MNMKVSVIRNWSSWRHVLAIIDRVKFKTQESTVDEMLLCEYLESIEIILGKDMDPVEDVKELVLEKFCRTMRLAIAKINEN